QKAGQGDLQAVSTDFQIDHVAEDVAEQQGEAQPVERLQPGFGQQARGIQSGHGFGPAEQQRGNRQGGDQQLSDDGNQPAAGEPADQRVAGQCRQPEQQAHASRSPAQGASRKQNSRPRLTASPKLATAGVCDSASRPNDSQVVIAASAVPSRLT